MDSYIDVEFQQRQHQEESQQPNSGLLRFRSAPSSLFANFRDTIDKDSTAFHNNDKNNKDDKGYANYVNTNQDSETFVSRYISNGGGGGRGDHSSSDLCFDGLETKSVRRMNPADGVVGNSHQLPPQYPKLQHELLSSVSGSTKMDMDYQSGNVVNGSSILARQRSSPAGFFDNPNFHNQATVGHTVMNGTGTFSGNYGADDESCPQRTRSRLKGQIDLSCHRSSIGNLPGIPEVRDENSKDTTTDIEHGVESRNGGDEDDARFFGPAGFSFTSWRSDSSYLLGDIPELRGDQHSIDKASSYPVASDASLAQDGKLSYCPSRGLSHHLSLPKTSAEMAATDKLIHFQDTIPWKIRAKRGCATHPRSIAERARRTRISERIKKLQDLVPNMDKQMNTADMLDLAVDYIKDLQRQHKALNDLRSSCRCSNV